MDPDSILGPSGYQRATAAAVVQGDGDEDDDAAGGEFAD